MLRIAVEYLRPGMVVGREIFDLDGRTILVKGATLKKNHIAILERWGVVSVYVVNPVFDIPEVDSIVEEKTRKQAVNIIKEFFEGAGKKHNFAISDEQKQLVKSIIDEIMRKRSTILQLSQIQRHHDDIFSHSVNVAVLSTMTAISMGIYSRDDLYIISLGAMLHDVGKVFVPKRVLLKQGALTRQETEILQEHTWAGFQLLRKFPEIPLVSAHIALQHHEQINGEGYPRKMVGQDIHLYSRIVSLANEYDNLVADKPGVKGMESHAAYEAMVAGVNVKFDPVAARAFLSRVSVYPIGTIVKLTTGNVGVVNEVSPLLQHRPQVKILTDN